MLQEWLKDLVLNMIKNDSLVIDKWYTTSWNGTLPLHDVSDCISIFPIDKFTIKKVDNVNLEWLINKITHPNVYGILIADDSKLQYVNPLTDLYFYPDRILQRRYQTCYIYYLKNEIKADKTSMQIANSIVEFMKTLLYKEDKLKTHQFDPNTPLKKLIEEEIELLSDDENVVLPVSITVWSGIVTPWYSMYMIRREKDKYRGYRICGYLTGNISSEDHEVCFGSRMPTNKSDIIDIMRKQNYDSVYFTRVLPENWDTILAAFKIAALKILEDAV